VIFKSLIPILCGIMLVGQTDALTPAELQQVGFDQHVGQSISLNLVFRDSQDKPVRLGDCLGNKPTLLVLGYFRCPMLCTVISDGLVESLQDLRLDIGKDFNVINISIDRNETPGLAAAKKAEYLKRYRRIGAEAGWHFLVGNDAVAAQVANEAGFRFRYDPASHQFAHPSGFIVLTPEGKISRYFFGVRFDSSELRDALSAAARHEQGSVLRQLVLLCFHYNPITGKYGVLIMNVIRAASIATAVGLIVLIGSLGSGRKRKVAGAECWKSEGGATATPAGVNVCDLGSPEVAPPSQRRSPDED
jgi:protein SCO1